MKYILSSIRITLFMMFILGLLYPILVTVASQVIFPKQAKGSLIYDGNQLRGSELIAQNFEKADYFWPRPSAISFNPLPSGGSNLGPTSQTLQEAMNERIKKIRSNHPDMGEIPQHLLFASASGLDPHQSVAAIQYQVKRVAAARGLSEADLSKLVTAHIETRQFGLLGEEIVNVLALNRALDKMSTTTGK